MNNVRYTTASYTKLFLLMIIPIYGLCFTVLLAFSKDIEEELKCLARGALIARVIFLIALGITITIFISYILPWISEYFNTLNILKLFL